MKEGDIIFQYQSVGNYNLDESAVVALSAEGCEVEPIVVRGIPTENIVTDGLAIHFDYGIPLMTMSGDPNGDGSANVGDAVFMVNLVFNEGPTPAIFEEGDVNCDGNLNVGDAVFLVNLVFNEGPDPCLYEAWK